MLTTEEMEYLLPEMVLVAGIILAVLVPNLGDSTFLYLSEEPDSRPPQTQEFLLE